MRTIEDIRRDNLRALIEEAGSAANLYRLTGVKQPIISQLARGVEHSSGGKTRQMGSDVARRLESGMGKPTGWMDVDHAAIENDSTLTGREGQLIGLFRLMNDGDQIDIINALTRKLRQPAPGVESAASPTDKTAKRH